MIAFVQFSQSKNYTKKSCVFISPFIAFKNAACTFTQSIFRQVVWPPRHVRCLWRPDAGDPQRHGHHSLVASARQAQQLGEGSPVLPGAYQQICVPQVK